MSILLIRELKGKEIISQSVDRQEGGGKKTSYAGVDLHSSIIAIAISIMRT